MTMLMMEDVMMMMMKMKMKMKMKMPSLTIEGDDRIMMMAIIML